MKKIYRHKFTLVELLAAMAVFSVLLLVSMQLFSGVQRVWVRAEQKTNSFADSRAAMEFIAARLQTMVYYSIKIDDNNSEQVPFGLKYYDSSTSSTIYFMTAMPMNRRKNGREIDLFKGFRFLRFKVENGELRMDIASAHNSTRFQYLVPPYESYYKNRPSEGDIFNKPYYDSTEDESSAVIVKNVTAFKLVPFDDDLKEKSSDTTLTEPPKMLRVELSIIDNADKFAEWQSADNDDDKKAIQEEFGYTFQRVVVLGK